MYNFNGVDISINKNALIFIISISHLELKWSRSLKKKFKIIYFIKFISFYHLARMYWATPMDQTWPLIS